ncbi:hypothetical protein [Microbacterium murale]|uniref:Lipoprotein n=1 Tax=Microbacterium murale TaxID=1081040 RepID=A0ABQ1R9E8_9MICO|nr:hypothetical protein [Microbacterium murale]GGD62966.1 hypothetical protein GCM10007269_02730 [Microbacterium murale]
MNIDRNLRSRILMTLPIAAVALSLAACAGGPGGGSGGSDRPSADELSTGITKILEDSGQSDLLTADQVDCIAGEFLDSEVSDQDLKNMAGGEDLQTSEEAKQLVTTTMQEAVTTCAATE